MFWQPEDVASRRAQEATRAIRARAQAIYEQRGRAEGHALDDWLAAEAQVLGSDHYRQRTRDAEERVGNSCEAALAAGLHQLTEPDGETEGDQDREAKCPPCQFLHMFVRRTGMIHSVCVICKSCIALSPREDALGFAEIVHEDKCSQSRNTETKSHGVA